MNTQQRLAVCKECSQRNGQSCKAVTDGVDILPIRASNPALDCPVNRWGDATEAVKSGKPTMAWFLGDLAKGGIANYVRTIVPALNKAGYKQLAIVIGSSIDLDEVAVDVISQVCPIYVIEDAYGAKSPKVRKVPNTIFQKVLNDADVVQLAGNLPEYHYFPEDLNWNAAEVWTQAHGVCGWTLKVIKHSMQFATKIVAVSQAVKANLIQHGYKASSIHVIRSVIDRNRLTGFLSQDAARTQFLDANQNDKYELNHDEAQRGCWLAYYGRLAPEKGIYRISRSVAALRRFCRDSGVISKHQRAWFDNLTLLVVGGGLLADETKAELLKILPARTVLSAWTESPADVFSAADMTLCMSDNEGGPLTVPESIMGCCPVASYQIGVVPELVYSTGSTHRLMYTPLSMDVGPDVTAHELFNVLVQRKPGYRTSSDYRAADECSRVFSLRNALAAWEQALK